MIAETAIPTLLEDWQQRRSQLEAEAHGASDQVVAFLRVLDYLIRRYQGTDVALKPVRATSARTTMVNTRAMVVHHHLWSGVVAGVKNPTQAQERIADILHHMEASKHRPIEDEKSDESDSVQPLVEPANYPYRAQFDGSVAWAFRLGIGRFWAVRRSLKRYPFLPKCAVEYLVEGPGLSAAQHVEAIELLGRCASRRVFGAVTEALADRLESSCDDGVTKALAKLLCKPTIQEFYYPKAIKVARARLRERLGAESYGKRRRAISVLALIGDLHDLSLLADLAGVCDPETDAEERAALIVAMESISRRPVA